MQYFKQLAGFILFCSAVTLIAACSGSGSDNESQTGIETMLTANALAPTNNALVAPPNVLRGLSADLKPPAN